MLFAGDTKIVGSGFFAQRVHADGGTVGGNITAAQLNWSSGDISGGGLVEILVELVSATTRTRLKSMEEH